MSLTVSKYEAGYTDADYQDPRNPNFADTGERVVWQIDGRGFWHSGKVYTPTQETLRWDKPPEGTTHAIGRQNGFAYVRIRKTGRGVVRICSGMYGTRVRITFCCWSWEDGYTFSDEIVGYMLHQ